MGDWLLTGPLGASTLLKAGLGAALALGVLYVLKLKLRRVLVPFAGMWASLLRESKSSVWWHRLKRLLSYLIQVLLASLFLVGAADPRSRRQFAKGRHILVILDTSASMKASDGKEGKNGLGPRSRFEEAKDRIRDLIASKRPRDRIMLVSMDSQVTPHTSWETDPEVLTDALNHMKASDAPADLARALRFSHDVLGSLSDPLLVLVGDGGYPPSVLQAVARRAPAPDAEKEPTARTAAAAAPREGPGSDPKEAGEPPTGRSSTKSRRPGKTNSRRAGRHGSSKTAPVKAPPPPPLGGGRTIAPVVLGNLPVYSILVGRSHNNIGIVAFNARRSLTDRSTFQVFAHIHNYRKRPATVQVQLYTGGQIPETAKMYIPAGQTATFVRQAVPAVEANLVMRIVPESGRGRLDDFSLDDQAYALVPRRPDARVLLVSEGNLFLEGALLLDEHTTYDRITHAAYRPDEAKAYNLVIFDGYHGEKLPEQGNFLLFDPEKGKSPIPIIKQVPNPPIMWPSQPKHHRHPIMRFVTVKNVNTVRASIFKLSGKDQPLMMTDERGPVFAAVRREHQRKIVVVGFSLSHTDWVIRVSFPVFLLDAINWFLGDDPRLIPTYRTGRVWRIAVDTDKDSIQALDPLKHRFVVPVESGVAQVFGKLTGYYLLATKSGKKKIAANLANQRESDIAVPDKLRFGKDAASWTPGPPKISAADETEEWHPANMIPGLIGLLLGLGLLALSFLVGSTAPLWALLSMVLLAGSVGWITYALEPTLWSSVTLAAVVVLMAEWLTYNRRVTV